MTIAVYGGSFDPIHLGHVMIAKAVAALDGIDGVLLTVSRQNPLKQGLRHPATDDDRLAMARLAVSGIPGIEVSDLEMHLPAPSYTYETLCELRRRHPGCDFRLVVGSDNLAQWHRWRNHDRILAEFGLIVYPRPGYELQAAGIPQGATMLTGVAEDPVSSSAIREALERGQWPIEGLDPAVALYIKEKGLYACGQ